MSEFFDIAKKNDPTIKDIREIKTIYKTSNEFGRAKGVLQCPFCNSMVEFYIWSISGGGKKCYCGVLHTTRYSILRYSKKELKQLKK